MSETSAKSEESGNNTDEIPLEELWIEKIARITKCELIGKKLTGKDNLGPYIFQWFFQLIFSIIMPILILFEYGWTPLFTIPFSYLFTFLVVTFAVWGTISLRNNYVKTIAELSDKKVIKGRKNYFPKNIKRIKYLIFFLGFCILLSQIISVDVIAIINNPSLVGTPGPENLLLFSSGIVYGIIESCIRLFVYLPLVTEFVTLFFSIHIVLPDKLRKYGIHFDFCDPTLFGGLRAIGILFKKSSTFYFTGLTIYLAGTIGAQYRFGFFSTTFFLGAWTLGFVLFFIPQIVIHNLMVKEKQKRLAELNPETNLKKPENDKETLDFIYNHLRYSFAEKIKEYPFDMSVLRDMFLTAIIPLSAELIIRISSGYFGL